MGNCFSSSRDIKSKDHITLGPQSSMIQEFNRFSVIAPILSEDFLPSSHWGYIALLLG